LILFFFVYRSNYLKKQVPIAKKDGMQDHVGDVSPDVQKKGLSGKLDAYRENYKDGDGYTAMNTMDDEAKKGTSYSSQYSQVEKRKLDSLDVLMKALNAKRTSAYGSSLPYATKPSLQNQGISKLSKQDQDLAKALSNLSESRNSRPKQTVNPKVNNTVKERDPMDVFKAQMAYMDSVSKDADPEVKAETERHKSMLKAEKAQKEEKILFVQKNDVVPSVFNTVKPFTEESLIMAIIDENVTGYAGSRIRLRLMEDIKVGNTVVKKGCYLYAIINGFTEQRVTLIVKYIFSENKILPVKLLIYGTDGLPGLYVPQSSFREFTKELGGNSMQGVNIQGTSQNQNQFLMSSVDKVFQSTSTAISSLISNRNLFFQVITSIHKKE